MSTFLGVPTDFFGGLGGFCQLGVYAGVPALFWLLCCCLVMKMERKKNKRGFYSILWSTLLT